MWTHQTKSKLSFWFALLLWISMLAACNLYKNRLDRSTMFEGTAMSDAAAAFKKKIGGSFKALSVQINPDSVTLRAQDPKQPSNVDEYRYSAFLRSVSGPHPVELSSLENNLDNTLFDFDSVNWAATQSLANEAIKRTQIDGGKIGKMTVERALAIGNLVTKSGSLGWTIEVKNSREHATAYAEPQGKITRLDLSHTSRAVSFNLISADALRDAASQIDANFGGHALVMDIAISDKSLRFKAVNPNSKEMSQYVYDINGIHNDVILDISATDQDVRRIQGGHKLEEILFELDSVNLERAAELGQRAMKRVGFENASISTIHVKREELVATNKLLTFWEVDCRGGRKWGIVTYDLSGKELGVRFE
jgi:hypothetical protein